MPSFKLIAIRPLASCDHSLLKKLKADEFYFFDNGFQPTPDLDYVQPSPDISDYVPEDFFYSAIGRETSLESINIQALVGKNGDGKSSLTELAIRIFNNFFKFKTVHEVTKNLICIKGLNAELYFALDKRIYRISVFHFEHGKPFGDFSFKDENGTIRPVDDQDFSGLFFVFNINYAHYSLNSLEFSGENYLDDRFSRTSPWLDQIFHRNDGYQTPMTIHPFRENGNIDIVNEKKLANQRLINLVLNENSYRKINHNLSVMGIKFENFETGPFENEVNKIRAEFEKRDAHDDTDPKFLKLVNKILSSTRQNQYFIHLMHHSLRNWTPIHFGDRDFQDNHNPDEVKEMLDLAPEEKIKHFLAFLNIEGVMEIMKLFLMCRWVGPSGSATNRKDALEDKLNQYMIVKAKKILRYPKYKSIRLRIEAGEESISGFGYLKSLINDKSHITLKFKQASTLLNLIKSYPGSSLVNFYRDFVQGEIKSKIVGISEFRSLIFEAMRQLGDDKIKMYLNPPGIFQATMMLDRANLQDPIAISSISSGEYQRIGLVSSIIYHLKNLDSIDTSTNDGDISYDKVLLVLDEIELYFHPDFQRALLNDLVTKISEVKFEQIKAINMLFVTHSPFILSDIPKKNVLFLEDGVQAFPMTENTFGANIHTLLQHGFFLNGMPIGEFAKNKINDLFTIVNTKENISNFPDLEKRILMVSEPFLRSQLLKAYHERRGTKTIDELVQRIDDLEKLIRDNNQPE